MIKPEKWFHLWYVKNVCISYIIDVKTGYSNVHSTLKKNQKGEHIKNVNELLTLSVEELLKHFIALFYDLQKQRIVSLMNFWAISFVDIGLYVCYYDTGWLWVDGFVGTAHLATFTLISKLTMNALWIVVLGRVRWLFLSEVIKAKKK